jgi:hypothetical protein
MHAGKANNQRLEHFERFLEARIAHPELQESQCEFSAP